jgi:hypothetical protein
VNIIKDPSPKSFSSLGDNSKGLELLNVAFKLIFGALIFGDKRSQTCKK